MSDTVIRFAALLAALGGAAGAHAQQCAATGGLEFVCGPKNAEDLVLVPGTRWIIASGMAEGAGFALIDSQRDTFKPLSIAGQRHDASAFPACATPPDAGKLNTHGLSLRSGAAGRATLYAVGHGGREAIEVFDVDASGAEPVLTWKGCVPMPDGLAANSVASFADGSLLATVLLLPGKTFADSIAKRPTGAVYEWSPGARGFELVAGSELPSNNGIETSADGTEFYVASSGFQQIVAFSHANPTKELRRSAPLPITPDNVHRSPDGRLLTAGMKNDVPECGGAPGPQHTLEALGACPRPTIVVAIDPQTMRDSVLLETPRITSFSNATMALPVGDELWIGTFSGDRVAHGKPR